ncbi:MAG: secretin N-terminal domain-containing protein [Candidatus Omnitrophota bacterium]
MRKPVNKDTAAVRPQSFIKTLSISFLFAVISFGGGGFYDFLIRPVYPQEEIPAALNQKFNKKISLDLRDMNAVDVYKFLAFKGDFNISISKDITGRVTLFLKEVSIKDAMDIISIANRLAYRVVGEDIVHIMSEAEYLSLYGKKFSDKREVKIIYLKYAKPAYILEALKNLKSEIGKVVIDEDTGSLVMIDTNEHIAIMEDSIRKMDHQLEMKVYDLKYAKAEDVSIQLKQKLDNKAVGSVQADARSNQLIVRAFPERLKEVEEIIRALDKKTKAVLIEARILKIILNPQWDRGIDWESIFRGIKNFNLVGSFPISSSISTAAALGTVGKIAFGDLNEDNFTTELKILKQVAETKVLANPSILVTNNEEARIHIGDKLAFVTTTTIGTGESQQVNEEIHYIDVGVQFKVTPTINEDGFITMKIQPEISSKSGELETPQGAKVPLINTTMVESTVIIRDGNTIIIGGLRQDELIKVKKGIPMLMDMPLVGGVFSNSSKEKTQTEIAILLTPHIISGEENFADQKTGAESLIKSDKKY